MQVSIAGHTFKAADRYAEGHAINANEAASLNQTLMENVGNNMRELVKKHAGDPAELQAQFDKYLAAYQFGVRAARGPSAPSDPVGAEAHRLAVVFLKGKIKAAQAKTGKSLKDYPMAQINEAARNLLGTEKGETFKAQAQSNVDALAAAAADSTAELTELGLTPTEAPATQPEATPTEAATHGEGQSSEEVVSDQPSPTPSRRRR